MTHEQERGIVCGLEEAVSLVPQEATVYFGGAVLVRKPMAFARALARSDLTVHLVTFAGSLEVELLAAAGRLRSVASAYVGLGPFGFAPRFSEGVKSAAFADREHTEWTLLQGLRAAAMGVPFLPTRAGMGSEVVASLSVAEISDPYGGGRYLAIPPLRPDVTVIHAWRACPQGHVQMPWPPEHLQDVDVLAARAARQAIVTVEEIVPESEVLRSSQLTRLFGFEISAVVEAPGGAWPTASPPLAAEDRSAIARYAASGGDPDVLEPEGSG